MTDAEAALQPAPEAFARAYARGGGVVWSRHVSDLETPVSALLKLGASKPGAFLLESVQGGDFRGRYSIRAEARSGLAGAPRTRRDQPRRLRRRRVSPAARSAHQEPAQAPGPLRA